MNAVEFWRGATGFQPDSPGKPVGCAPCRRSRGKPLLEIGIVSYGQMSEGCPSDRQTPSVLTHLKVRREVTHARHDGAPDLMRGEAADFPAAYAAMKGD